MHKCYPGQSLPVKGKRLRIARLDYDILMIDNNRYAIPANLNLLIVENQQVK